jgi:mycofactocin system glycosyltransferase
VPAAALVVRVEALHQVGGFDPGLRVGEDVDLVWRLDEAGWRCRYEPASVVEHRPRPDLGAWARQRMAYGRSAGELSRRHPGALAPASVSGWSAGAWGLAAAGWPLAGGALTLGAGLALGAKLGGRKALDAPWTESLRLVIRGTMFAGAQLATAMRRAWWPLALAAAVPSRRARRAVMAAAVVPPLLTWLRRRPALDPARFVALQVADDAAYGVGLWQGCWRARTVAPLVPDLTSWPRPARSARADTRAP